jgi:hypothetical protein
MSTRATYKIVSEGGQPNITLYIHHDGYPEGAAEYFYNLLNVENRRGGWATQMIRANDGAEITGSHELHGDTEYRYNLYESTNSVEAIKEIGSDNETWQTFFSGSIVDFIKKYIKDADFVEFHGYSDSQVMPRERARRLALDTFSYIDRWQDNDFSQHIGNVSSTVSSCLKNLHLFEAKELEIIERARIASLKAFPHCKEFQISILQVA